MDEHAFKKGQWSFYKNADCPFNEGTLKQKEWQRGYNAAYFENQAKLKEKAQ